jgi:hypothetical protein
MAGPFLLVLESLSVGASERQSVRNATILGATPEITGRRRCATGIEITQKRGEQDPIEAVARWRDS